MNPTNLTNDIQNWARALSREVKKPEDIRRAIDALGAMRKELLDSLESSQTQKALLGLADRYGFEEDLKNASPFVFTNGRWLMYSEKNKITLQVETTPDRIGEILASLWSVGELYP